METTASKSYKPVSGKGGFLPKEVLTVEFNPARKLAHFVIRLRNIPGALERSSSLATKYSVNILSGFHHAPSASEEAFWSFFADFTQAEVTPDRLAQELKSLPSTLEVRSQVPPNGLLIDTFHFPLQWGGRRAITMRTDSMGSIFARVNGIFGDGPAARVVIFEMGEAAGMAIYKDLAAVIGRDLIKEELPNVICLYAANGWGLFEVIRVDYERNTATIRVRENFECGYYTGRSTTPRSNFVRGHMAGWFKELFGRRVEVTESQCVAKGDSCCEFSIEAPSLDEPLA